MIRWHSIQGAVTDLKLGVFLSQTPDSFDRMWKRVSRLYDKESLITFYFEIQREYHEYMILDHPKN